MRTLRGLLPLLSSLLAIGAFALVQFAAEREGLRFEALIVALTPLLLLGWWQCRVMQRTLAALPEALRSGSTYQEVMNAIYLRLGIRPRMQATYQVGTRLTAWIVGAAALSALAAGDIAPLPLALGGALVGTVLQLSMQSYTVVFALGRLSETEREVAMGSLKRLASLSKSDNSPQNS